MGIAEGMEAVMEAGAGEGTTVEDGMEEAARQGTEAECIGAAMVEVMAGNVNFYVS